MKMKNIVQPTSIPKAIRVLVFLLLTLLLGLSAHASDLGLTEADCRCCHGPTLADRHHLLVNNSGLECLSCHEMTWNPADLQYEAKVVRDCLLCHTGSLADRHHVLVDQVTYDCFSCHAMVWDPATLMYVADFNVSCEPSPSPAVSLGSVNGTVTDPAGTGLGWVQVAAADNSYTTLSTDTGSYQLADVAPGDYILVASLDGYNNASQALSIVDGQTASVDFVLTPIVNPGSITGVVHDANMVPISGASVSSADGLYSALSGANGTYTLVDVVDGTYLLTAEKDGFLTASQSVTAAPGQTLTADFVLPDLPVEVCGDGIDNDANALTDCDDPACANDAGCLPPVLEICDDGIDNDTNALTDCDDPACTGAAACLPPMEICGDGMDNDANGLTDCGDPVCMGTSSCPPPAVETCGDGIDNNGDGLLDCADPLCSASTGCLPEDCNDALDNDGNGLIDCDDPACTGTSKCLPPPVEICDDGLDNDGNGMVDCADGKCANHSSCYQPVPEENCNNGIDDNGDSYIDCADTQCMDRSVCLEEICGNGGDDDGDGQADCADSDCSSDPSCTVPEPPQPLSFSARASDSEYSYGADQAADGDMSTRWWVDEDEDEWLRLDLGGLVTVNKVVIHWHREYAEDYKVKVSKDGRYWKTVKEIDNSDGGTDTISFTATEARYILIDCENADHDGFSIYELEVQQPSFAASAADPGAGGSGSAASVPSEPSNENLALNQPAKSSDSEYRYEPYKAVDGDMSTRWWANDYRDEWLRVDLGRITTVGKVVIHWHREYAEDYQVKVSRDGYHWTTVMEISRGNGGLDTISFAAREARYVLIDCEDAAGDSSSSDSDGFSIYELEVYRQ